MRNQLFYAAALVAAVSCTNGDFLFSGAIEGVPGVLHITGEDGGPIVPFDPLAGFETTCAAEIELDEQCAAGTEPAGTDCEAAATALTDCEFGVRRQAVEENTIYAEVGPTGTSELGGATFNFLGDGGSVCVFVDPELLHWNQSVSTQAANRHWRYPDNPYDDGDMDLSAGLSVYYTGTEAELMGGFEVQYQDSLGNTVPVNLVSCAITSDVLGFNPTATSGRGAPEFCTVTNTQPGVSYTVALTAYAVPPDDDRLSFGMVLADGPCGPFVNRGTPVENPAIGPVNLECLVRGEAIPPIEGESQLYYGYEEGRSWPGSEDFEDYFCSGERMPPFCNDEVALKDEAGVTCDFTAPGSVDEKCYCGDPRDTPSNTVQ